MWGHPNTQVFAASCITLDESYESTATAGPINWKQASICKTVGNSVKEFSSLSSSCICDRICQNPPHTHNKMSTSLLILSSHWVPLIHFISTIVVITFKFSTSSTIVIISYYVHTLFWLEIWDINHNYKNKC